MCALEVQHVSYNSFLQWLAWNQFSIGIAWINKWINKRILFWIRSQDIQALVANLLLRSLRTLNKHMNSLDRIFHTWTYIAGILSGLIYLELVFTKRNKVPPKKDKAITDNTDKLVHEQWVGVEEGCGSWIYPGLSLWWFSSLGHGNLICTSKLSGLFFSSFFPTNYFTGFVTWVCQLH